MVTQNAPAPLHPPQCGGGLQPEAPSGHLTHQQLQFLLRVAPLALATEHEFEIPAPVTVALAILESATAAGWGSSPLFRLANDPFGIRSCHSSAQPTRAFWATTTEIKNGHKVVIEAEFERFRNLDKAFRAHALLLRGPRYRAAFAVRSDWKKFAERLGPKTSPLDLEHCGYSTNPSYSAELIRLIALYRLDDRRALTWYATGEDPGPRATEPLDHGDAGSAGEGVNGPLGQQVVAPQVDSGDGATTDRVGAGSSPLPDAAGGPAR